MPSNTYPIIAREGWLPAGLLILLLVIAVYLHGITVTLITAALLLVFLFLVRDPIQDVPSSPLAIVSPVHGRIVADNEVEDDWIKRPARQLILQMSPLDIYSLRSPIEGKVVNQWTRKPDGQHSNRLFAFRVRGDGGDEVFAGYNRYGQGLALAKASRRLPVLCSLRRASGPWTTLRVPLSGWTH